MAGRVAPPSSRRKIVSTVWVGAKKRCDRLGAAFEGRAAVGVVGHEDGGPLRQRLA